VATLPDIATALIAVGVLALIMRWVFRPSRPNVRPTRPVDATDAENLGLLTVVLSGVSRQDAAERRSTLSAAGIRSSVSARRDGTVDVLVFRADADRARILLGP
jgi:hypothetical protein